MKNCFSDVCYFTVGGIVTIVVSTLVSTKLEDYQYYTTLLLLDVSE